MTIAELDGILAELSMYQKTLDYNEWYRTAFLASVICNVNRGKRGKRIKPSDFLGPPPWEKENKPEKIDRERREKEFEELKKRFEGVV